MADSATDILSLADAKRHLRIEDDTHDALVTDYIGQAVDQAARSTGRQLLGEGAEDASQDMRALIVLLVSCYFDGLPTNHPSVVMLMKQLRKSFDA